MKRVRNTQKGFPAGCPLPYSLQQEVLKNTSQNHRACSICKGMAEKTEEFRINCNWLRGWQKFFEK